MNKTLTKLASVIEANNGIAKPKTKVQFHYVATVSYVNDIAEIPIVGTLSDVSFSESGNDRYITYKITSEKGDIYIDYDIKHNFTCVNYCFDDDECHETIDKNLPIKLVRTILHSF